MTGLVKKSSEQASNEADKIKSRHEQYGQERCKVIEGERTNKKKARTPKQKIDTSKS